MRWRNATTSPVAYLIPIVHTDFNDLPENGLRWAFVQWPVEIGQRVRLDDHEGTFCYGRVVRWAAYGAPGEYVDVEPEPDSWGHYEPEAV